MVEIGEPAREADRDWVCLVRRTEPIFQAGERDDKIVVEAEHFETQTLDDQRRWYELKKSGAMPELEGAGEPQTWVRGILSASKTASRGRFLRLLPDTRRTHDDKSIRGENFSPEPGKLAVLSYRVHFDRPGRYYVWVRAFSTGTEDNGLHVGLDGHWPEHGQRMQWCKGKYRWTWGCAQRREDDHCGVPMEIYLDVEELGVHTVQFSMREDGFAFDQFLLTRDGEHRPDGIETGESVRFTPPSEPTNRTTPTTEMIFPGDNWVTGTPESQGIDSDKLQSALAYIAGHCKQDKLSELMIIRNGVCIHQGDNTAKVHNIWSCTKSFTSTVLGLLIADGECDLDTRAAEIVSELRPLYPNATLRHFTTMTSGFSAKGRSRWDDENEDWSWSPYEPAAPYFEPGTAYAYWDEAQMTLGRMLTRISGRELGDYLDKRLFQPIGMGNVEWLHQGEIDGIPICNGCTNVMLSARQLARFGHLFLNRGDWNGKQIIPAEWIDVATKNQVPVNSSVKSGCQPAA